MSEIVLDMVLKKEYVKVIKKEVQAKKGSYQILDSGCNFKSYLIIGPYDNCPR